MINKNYDNLQKESQYFEADHISEPRVGLIQDIVDTNFPMFAEDPDGPNKPAIVVDGFSKPIVINWSNFKVLKDQISTERGVFSGCVSQYVCVDKTYYDSFGKWGIVLRPLSRLEHQAIHGGTTEQKPKEFDDDIPF